MSDYRLSHLLDLPILQKMADAHYLAAGMPIGIIDAIDGSILVGSGWQDICVKYHRTNPVSLKRCQESDNYIKDRLVEGEACHYKCQNGLWDIGMPIVIAGRHLATMFLGQFFYDGEAPDREFFIKQARELNFDVDEYLAALDRVQVFKRDKVEYILEYDKALVRFISDLAEHALLKIKADGIIRENERKFHAIFNQSYQFLRLLSVDGRLQEANQTSLRFSGVKEADVIGKPFWETPWWTHSPELQEKFRLAIQKAAKGEFVRFEATHSAADGTLHDFDFSLKPVMDNAGKVILLIPEGRDITERKQIEEELRNSRDELELRVRERTAELKKLNEAMLLTNRALEDFSHVASHDLQEPLRKIMTFSERLVHIDPGILNDQMRDYLARMGQAAAQMQALIQDLAKYSRVTSSPSHFKVINLRKPVEEAFIDLVYNPFFFNTVFQDQHQVMRNYATF